jgi:hypothetical protein
MQPPSLWQFRPCLFRRHVLGVPVGPVRVALAAEAFFVLAVGCLGTPHRARQVACGAERSYSSVNASGQSRRDLLQHALRSAVPGAAC